MKRILSLSAICYLLSAIAPMAQAQSTQYIASVTFTNMLTGTTNGDTITVNADVRTYTNNVSSSPSTLILSTNSVTHSATNTLYQIAANALPDVERVLWANTNAFDIYSLFDETLTVSLSTGVGTVTYQTNVFQAQYPLNLPIDSEIVASARTNQQSLLIEALGKDWTTSAVPQNAPGWVNFMQVTLTQTASNKTLTLSTVKDSVVTNSELQGGVITNSRLILLRFTDASDAIYLESSLPATNKIVVSEETQPQLVDWNGNWVTNSSPSLGDILNYTSMRAVFPSYLATFVNYWASTNIFTNNQASIAFFNGFVSTNAVLAKGWLISGTNTGYAFQSYTNGAETGFMAGQNAHAAGASATAVGTSAYGADSSDTALGAVAQATGAYGTAVGPNTTVSAARGTAVGYNTTVSGQSSVALGFNASATNDNEIVLGSNQVVRVPGLFAPAMSTNIVTKGTNRIDGALGFGKRTEATLASGNNIITNAFNDIWVDLTGPAAATTIDGATEGWPGRTITYTKRNGGYNMVIANESGLAPAGMRILTGTAASVTVTNSPGYIRLLYDGDVSRWILIGHSN